MKVFVISPYVPYDGVCHAGGKIHNFYIKKLASDPQLEVCLVTFCEGGEQSGIEKELEEAGIMAYIIERNYSGYYKLLHYIRKCNILFDKYATLAAKDIQHNLKKTIQMLQSQNYYPDIVIMAWTQIAIQIDMLKKYYPKAKYIAVEHDVNFLGIERRYKSTKNHWIKKLFKLKAKRGKELELRAMHNFEKIIIYNKKDWKLLKDNGISDKQLVVLAPYLQRNTMKRLEWKSDGKTIVFYGAMNRIENAEAVEWFIKQVWPEIESLGLEFAVIGANPSEAVKQYHGGNINIAGFVEDIGEYFSKCVCMVVPLLHGAGIKIKVLEGMEYGVPVLTNEIGIEGIEAEDGVHYLKCITPEDYKNKIIQLLNGEIDSDRLSENAMKFMHDNFDYEKDAVFYIELLKELGRNI